MPNINSADYYQAIQSVRNQAMDMTKWLEYFSEGLAMQLSEIKKLGRRVIEQSFLVKQYRLSERQKKIIEYINEHESLAIQELENIFPGATRRTLQRELKDLINKEIIIGMGATNNLTYRLKE